MEFETRRPDTPPAVVGVEGGRAHDVHPARDDDIAEAAADLHGGVEDGLEARSATAVDLDAGDRVGQPRVEGGDPADRGGVGGRVGVAQDHLVDPLGIDPGAADDLGDDERRETGRTLVRERAAEAPDRCAQRLADDDIGLFGHATAFPWWGKLYGGTVPTEPRTPAPRRSNT